MGKVYDRTPVDETGNELALEYFGGDEMDRMTGIVFYYVLIHSQTMIL